MYKLFSILLSCLACTIYGQNLQQSFTLLPGEKWMGALVEEGYRMPFKEGYQTDLYGNSATNQASPLLLSTKGRYIWSEAPFSFKITDKELVVWPFQNAVLESGQSGKTLREAYLKASNRFFPPTGKIPEPMLFIRPQYNTWIELVYNQNQEDILKYARGIIDQGFPPGVLMIDDNWAPYYGKFEFRKDRFPDAQGMIRELHDMGYKVMIWVCPFISPDSEVFRELESKRLLVMTSDGDASLTWEKASVPAIIRWWNGQSAAMDFTREEAIEWYASQLDNMIKEYKVDGFKFDAGDPEFYTGDIISHRKVSPNEHCTLWGSLGLRYPLNEYRAMWKMGGQPLVERLRDKGHNWDDLTKLIPNITIAALLGYPFACPDMIGGGEFGSFIGRDKLDQELVVRSAQCSALMPMMQFSVAPWRVLDETHLSAVRKAVKIREKMTGEIYKLAERSTSTGEPIVCNMEYIFPNQGFEMCKDQFMLGANVLVAPMVSKGTKRTVSFPKGKWIGDDDTLVSGPAIKEIAVPLDRLPYYRLIK